MSNKQNNSDSKNLFENLERDFSFLDDYEKTANQEFKAKQMSASTKTVKKEKINDLNNYDFLNPFEVNDKSNPDKKEPLSPEEEHINKKRETFENTKYGKYMNESNNSEIDSLEKAYQIFDIKPEVESNMDLLESIDNQALENLKESLKGSEIRLSAFLNKEFNVLNMKMIKCCIFCYEKIDQFSVKEAKVCAETCNKNIVEAKNFAEKKQEEKVNKLNYCVESIKDIKDGADFMLKYKDCYRELQKDLIQLENEIKMEFNNYI